MIRPFLAALALAGLVMVTLWGVLVMVRNSLAVVDRNSISAASEANVQSAPIPAPAPGGRVAFSQGGRIGMALANGSGARFLTAGPGDHSPAWSPDGTLVAFVAAGGPERSGVYVVSAEGAQERRVAQGGGLHSRPSWSPDSRKLVFLDRAVGKQGLVVVNADGSELTQIFKGAANAPAWSPDGRWIAFTFNPGPTRGGVYVTDPDGAEAKVVLGGVFGDVTWSPDSASLAVRGLAWLSGEPAGIRGALAREQVVVVQRTSGKAALLTEDAAGGDWAPVWSPDGTWVAAVMAGEAGQRLVALPVVGGAERTLAQGQRFISPAWSADGAALAVAQPQGEGPQAQVSIVKADASGTRPFAPGEFPAWAR
ncbi:MAG: PD40 domain-containing protein [Chloroflexi bacterium]|nr:PD40 domain-containing protein [Chloroflexota bacterium]